MKTKTDFFEILDIERASSSMYGDPSYWLTLKATSGEIIRAKAVTNFAQIGKNKKSILNFTKHQTKK